MISRASNRAKKRLATPRDHGWQLTRTRSAIQKLLVLRSQTVIGVPHADFGEAVVAVVAPKPGSLLDAKQIQSAIASDLAKYKQPKRVFVTTDIPRNAMGKIQKKDLRATYNATFRTT